MAAITLPHEYPSYAGPPAMSMVAGAAIQEPYAAVKVGAAAGLAIQTSDSTGCIGFAKSDTGLTYNAASSTAQIASGERIQVYGTGNRVWAVAGAAITAGVKVMAAAGGQVVAHTTGLQFVGTAITGAAAQHELVCIEVALGPTV